MLASKFSLRASLLFTLRWSRASGDRVCAPREFIVVEKTMSDKQITYSSGDEISYKLKDEDFFRTDHIVALNDTAIEFHYNMIAFHEISAINIKGKRFGNFNLKAVGTYAQIAGLGYIAIDQFNQVVVSGEDASFNESVWLAGGLVFVGGTILKIIAPKKIRVGGKYRIRYMNLTPY
jgi:hypothetical protein